MGNGARRVRKALRLHYDPVKQTLAKLLRGRILRRAFHLSLDVLFLRAWYVRRELRRIKGDLAATPPSIEGGESGASQAGGKIRSQKSEIRNILDAGMGFGQYSDRMARMFKDAKLVGLEIDRAHFYGGESYFRKVHPGFEFVLGDVQRLPLKGDRFDLIITVDVMEHILDDRATFAEYARVLKPGGRLLMHTPRDRGESGVWSLELGIEERASDASAPDSKLQTPSWTVGEHVRDGYRDENAREKIEAAGLVIERIVRGYGKPGMIAWTLLQRIPMSALGRSRWLLPLVTVWLIVALPVALIAMALDLAPGDRPAGGSLLVAARKPR